MKRTLFALFVAAAMISPASAADDKNSTRRSVGAHPVVYDDYPESDVVLDVGPDIVLTVTGEARTRFEWVENATDFSNRGAAGPGDDAAFDDSYSYAPARFNLGIRADLPRDVAAVIELQGNFELGGGILGTGTELRAQQTQHQRPGVLNPQLLGPAITRVGGVGGVLGAGGLGNAQGGPGSVSDPKHLEIVRTLNSLSGDGAYVYQGYIEAAHIGDSIFSARFGRQELAYGTEFLLGNQDFYDGQTFDGVKGILEFSDNSRLDLFWAKLAERDTTIDGNQKGDDSDLYGAYFSAQSLGGSSVGMDAYAIGLIDNANLVYTIATDPTGDHLTAPTGYALTPGKSFMDAYWTGVRFFREREHGFHFSAEATYLFGRIEANVDKTSNGASADDDNSLNISAWGFEGFAGYTWNTATNPTVKGGVTYASGSDAGDLQNGNYHTFFTPAGEVHPRLGLMDLVDASNILAFNLGYTGSYNCHSWGVDLYHFELPEVDPLVDFAFVSQLAPAGDDLSKELGQEVDLWYNYQYSEHMVAQFAVAYFNAGDFIRDRNRCGVPFAAGGAGDCNPDTDLSDATSIRTNDAWRVYANLLVRF